MSKTAIHRIDEFREHKGLPDSDIEAKMGYSNGGFRKAVNGNSKVGDERLKALLEIFPEINLQWVVTGEGEMYGNESQFTAASAALFIRENHEKMKKDDPLYKMWFEGKVKEGVIEYLLERSKEE